MNTQEIDKLWQEFSPFETVEECKEETGEERVYVGDDLWIFPDGKIEQEGIENE
jgi:hypothetical protein